MKKTCWLITCLMAGIYMVSGQAISVPFTPDRWNMENAETSMETFNGKECILVKTGAIITKNIDLRDGTIEFDMSFPQQRGFPGIGFRVLGMDNFEHFYVRPHQSGNPDATQYTPVFYGMAGWQLYHGEGYSKAIPFKFDQWHHIKIDMHGIEAEIYIDNMQTPFIKVTELKHGWKSGNIAFIPGNLPTRFANLQYSSRQVNEPSPIPVPANGTGGLITQYQVSNQVNSTLFQDQLQLTPDIKSKLKFTKQPTESSGTINLAKFMQANDTGRVIVAKIVVQSETDQVKELSFGFSDYVRVYLNDKALYGGKDNFLSRDYRYLGTIGFFDKLFLPLKKGANELWFVVAEDFGGWGVKAKFEDMSGIGLR